MKKYLSCVALVLFAAASALAQTGSANGSFTFTPSTQFITSNTSFTISVGYTGMTPPADIAGFDLFLLTSSANSGLFSINGITATGPFTVAAGGGTYPDSIDNTSFTTSGFVSNHNDLGFVDSNGSHDQTSPYNFTLETITIMPGVLVPGMTYTFFSSTTANTNGFYSDVSNANGDTYDTPVSSFSVTTVPEPSLALAAIGGAGIIAYALRRRRARIAD